MTIKEFLKAMWLNLTEPNPMYHDYPGVPHTSPKIDMTDCMTTLAQIIEAENKKKFEDTLFTPEYQSLLESRIAAQRCFGMRR